MRYDFIVQSVPQKFKLHFLSRRWQIIILKLQCHVNGPKLWHYKKGSKHPGAKKLWWGKGGSIRLKLSLAFFRLSLLRGNNSGGVGGTATRRLKSEILRVGSGGSR